MNAMACHQHTERKLKHLNYFMKINTRKNLTLNNQEWQTKKINNKVLIKETIKNYANKLIYFTIEAQHNNTPWRL